jgi:hypothetical protein
VIAAEIKAVVTDGQSVVERRSSEFINTLRAVVGDVKRHYRCLIVVALATFRTADCLTLRPRII